MIQLRVAAGNMSAKSRQPIERYDDDAIVGI
jgi:hypothetical protein